MATSLGDLLETLCAAADSAPALARSRADAAAAIGHLGRALSRLKIDGVSGDVGDQREQQIAALGATCTGLAARAPISDGRLSDLAGVAADLAGRLRDETTVGGRWAIAAEVTLAVDAVIDAIGRGLVTPPADRWVAEVRRLADQVQHDAARHPPALAHHNALDRPIPSPGGTIEHPAAIVMDATAAIVDAIRPTSAPLTISEMLAVAIAGESFCDAAAALAIARSPDAPVAFVEHRLGHDAGQAWHAVRSALRPFNDGSRRPYTHVPPVVAAAHTLRTQLSALVGALVGEPGPTSPEILDALAHAAQHWPAISLYLGRTVAAWPTQHPVLAYACDLPVRNDRLTAQLAGRHPAGLVRADAADLEVVGAALGTTRLLSAALATDLAASSTATPTHARAAQHPVQTGHTGSPHPLGPAPYESAPPARRHGPSSLRLAATNRAFLDQAHTRERLNEAKAEAHRQLHGSQPPTQSRCAR
jgi:hypothetical protein